MIIARNNLSKQEYIEQLKQHYIDMFFNEFSALPNKNNQGQIDKIIEYINNPVK